MSAAARARALAPLLLLAYLLLTVAGLYLFRGVPVLNVALGFPLGAAVALHAGERPLRALLWWAVTTSAVVMLFCWLELAVSMVAMRTGGPLAIAWRWVPLFPPPSSAELVRTQFFAVVTAPLLQVLTTSFGGLMALVLKGERI